MEIKKYIPADKPKQPQEQVHEHCGTPECCGKCDTADTGEPND